MTVYTKQHFNIYRVGKEHIVHNTRKEFSTGHTHVKSFNYAKQLIHNVLGAKRPKTRNLYLLESHKRIADDDRYIQLIEELKTSRRKGKPGYRNDTGRKKI